MGRGDVMTELPRGRCSVCLAEVALRVTGVTREHRPTPESDVCPGSGKPPHIGRVADIPIAAVAPILKEPPVTGSILETSPAAEVAHQADQSIRQTVRQMRGLWVELAEKLYRFHQAEMWRDLGHDTFESWLADPELEGELTRRWVFELIGMYRTLVVERSVPMAELGQLHVSKVREVLPAIRRGWVDIETAFSDVETLTRRDMEIKYRGLASSTPGQPSLGTTVETGSEPVWTTCGECGRPYQVQS